MTTQTKTHTPDRGFTLIELLVVIAIISVLATLLFPAVKAALLAGQATSVGSDGKQIWTGLYAVSLENEVAGRPPVWPRADAYQTSTAYFQDCFSSNWLSGKYTFKYLSAPGLTAVSSVEPTDFSADNNAWCLVLGTDDNTKDETPFMFTRNLTSTTGGSRLTDIDGFDKDINPFCDGIAVVVSVGGGIRLIRGRDAGPGLQTQFNPLGEALTFVVP